MQAKRCTQHRTDNEAGWAGYYQNETRRKDGCAQADRGSTQHLNMLAAYVIAVGTKANKRGDACVLHPAWSNRCHGDDNDQCHSLLTEREASVLLVQSQLLPPTVQAYFCLVCWPLETNYLTSVGGSGRKLCAYRPQLRWPPMGGHACYFTARASALTTTEGRVLADP